MAFPAAGAHPAGALRRIRAEQRRAFLLSPDALPKIRARHVACPRTPLPGSRFAAPRFALVRTCLLCKVRA